MQVEKHTTDSAARDTHPCEAALRTLLQQITETADQLASTLDAPDLEGARSRLPGHPRPGGASRRPTLTIAEVLLECEAYTAVTAPVALTSGDFVRARAEASRLRHSLVQAITASTRQQRRLAEASARVADPSARSALDQPQVQADLARLLQLFSRLASLKERSLPASGPLGQRRALWSRPFFRSRLLIPGTVVATALVVIVFLLATIAFATGTGAISGMRPVLGTLTNTSAITATQQPGKTPAPPATQTIPTRGPTPPPNGPTLSVSQLNQPLCPDAHFLITLSVGSVRSPGTLPPPIPQRLYPGLMARPFTPPSAGHCSLGSPSPSMCERCRASRCLSRSPSPRVTVPPQTVRYDTSDC